MSVDTSLISNKKATLEIKSSAFNIPALVLSSHNIAEIKQHLQTKILQAPEFFKNSPLLIDLHELTKQEAEIDLRNLIKTLRSLNLIPIAISGAAPKQNDIAIALGIAVQSKHVLSQLEPPVVEKKPPEAEIAAEIEPETEAGLGKISSVIENKLITQPVRSGQRIYARGDLTVLAPVSSSAELIAEGNIHIYAPMRGRALAGVQGNTKSCIFCSDLQAELVSIAGIYRLSEEFDKNFRQKLVQIYLHDQTLLIKKL